MRRQRGASGKGEKEQGSPWVCPDASDVSGAYDYVIVGGGTAGCVIATRLSQDPRVRVLVIERGQDETQNPDVAVPTQNSVLLNVNYNTLPAEVEWSSEASKYTGIISTDSYQLIVAWALGGGPAVSGSFWGRGDPANFAEWESLGATGWGYNDVLPYYKGAENYKQPYYPSVPINPARGQNGPIETLGLNGLQDVIQPVIAAQQQVSGLPIVVDYNTPAGQLGISAMQRNTGHNLNVPVRNTTWTKYLKPVLHRRNLQVLPRATLLKINWDKRPWGKKRAVSIDFVYNNSTFRVKINKELILSAGALNTPRLLLVSGFGPKQHLIERNVPVVSDVPGIGRNLTDHMVFSHTFVMNPALFSSLTDATTPTIQFAMSDPSSGRIDTELAWTILPPFTPESPPLLVMYLVGLRNSFRGYVELKDNDTLYRPYIRYNLAETASDFDKMIKLFREVKAWFKVLQAQGYALIEYGTYAAIQEDAPDAEWLALLRPNVQNWWHPASTCKMGNTNTDPMAVVDPKLRLRNTLNVRIADNSVQPVVVSTHPSATAIVIGERCAEFIKDDADAVEKELSLYSEDMEDEDDLIMEDDGDEIELESGQRTRTVRAAKPASNRSRVLLGLYFLLVLCAFALFALRAAQVDSSSTCDTSDAAVPWEEVEETSQSSVLLDPVPAAADVLVPGAYPAL